MKKIVTKMFCVDKKHRSSIESICEFLGEELKSLGDKFDNGNGVEKNFVNPMKYFKISSDLGNSNAMLNFGFGLEKGYLESPDLKEAMKYFKMSTDLGISHSFKAYNRLNH
jgi:TPR repeat protein